MGTLWQIPILVLLVLVSGFFSASETALMSLSRIRIRQLNDEHVRGAEKVKMLTKDPGRLLGAVLIGNNLANIGSSALATAVFIQYFGPAGVGLATAVMTIAILVFGEVAPKSIAAQNREGVSLKVAPIILGIVTVLTPLITLLSVVTNLVARVFGGRLDGEQPVVTEDELKTIVTVGHEEGVLEKEEKKMIDNVFQFGDFRVRDIMTPRVDMVVLSVDASYQDVLEVLRREQFSRIPVYEGHPDNIIGVLYLKDLWCLKERSPTEFSLRALLREPFFTYEFKRTADLFQEMRKGKIPMAIVLDEYGDTAGIVTMEDMVEEIVGEIDDEYDREEPPVKKVGEREFLVDGGTNLRELNDALGLNLDSDEFHSLGGFVVGLFGEIPQEGEKTEYNGVSFSVEDVKGNRVKKLRLKT